MPIRVFELARELNYSMDELGKRQKDLGLILNSPFSKVPDKIAEKVRGKLKKRKANACLDRKKVVRKAVKKRPVVKAKKADHEEPEVAPLELFDEPVDVSGASSIVAIEPPEDKLGQVQEDAQAVLEQVVEGEQPPVEAEDQELDVVEMKEERLNQSVEKEPVESITVAKRPVSVKPKAVKPKPSKPKPTPVDKRKGGASVPMELGKISRTGDDFEPGRIVSEAPTKAKSSSNSSSSSKKKKKRAGAASQERLAEWNNRYGVMVGPSARRSSNNNNNNNEPKGAKLQRMQLVYGHELPKTDRKSTSTREAVKRDLSVKISCPIDVGGLAERLRLKSTDVIKHLMTQGMFHTITDKVGRDVCESIALEFNCDVQFVDVMDVTSKVAKMVKNEDGEYVSRPPVITIMGHVDHGKTSLLDAIRNSQITEGESGGITQHIGGYQVEKNGSTLTFLDTPGHAAFTSMRARGANVTDIVILVVAADDGMKPQTEEAVNHAKEAGVPIIVAMNKIDLEGANPNRIKEQLSQLELIPEEWSGSTPFLPVSAKTGEGLDTLLEMVNLQSEMLELTADAKSLGDAVVVEAHQEPGRGVVASILVRNGKLKKGSPILCGRGHGFLRQMEDENGKQLKEASPSQVVKLTGLSECPSPGDILNVMPNVKRAKEMAAERQAVYREEQISAKQGLTMDSFMSQIGDSDRKEFKVLVKADVQGTVEALDQALSEIGNEEISVKLVHKGVGAITESDVLLAKASEAVILSFRVSADGKTRRMAQDEGVEIRQYDVIYSLIEEIEKTCEGMLDPDVIEHLVGDVEVRQVFRITNVGNIAGCYVKTGHVERNMAVRLVRDGSVVWSGKIQALRRFKEDVKRVESRYECGIRLENYEDIRVDDIVETYRYETVEKKLNP